MPPTAPRSTSAAALPAAVEARGVAHWATTGGSTAPAMYRHLGDPDHSGDPVGRRSTSGGATTASCRATTRCPTSSRSTTSSWTSARPRRVRRSARPGVASSHRPPVANLHPFPNAEAIGRGDGPEWAATRIAEALRRRPGCEQVDGVPGARPRSSSGIGGDGHILSVFPGSPAFDATGLDAGHPRADPHRAARRARDDDPGARRVSLATSSSSSTGAVKAEVIAAASSATDDDERRWPARVADVDQAHLAPRRGRGRAACRGDRRRREPPTIRPRHAGRRPVARRRLARAPGARRSTSRRPSRRRRASLAGRGDGPEPRRLGRRRPADDARSSRSSRCRRPMVEQLYVAPAWIGHGVGRRLIDLAKARRPDGLDLYCFQANTRARRFYERNGFVGRRLRATARATRSASRTSATRGDRRR